MHVRTLSIEGFRNLERDELRFVDSGLISIEGDNGQGKSNVLEAIGLLSDSNSFRRAATESLVNVEHESAFVRGEIENNGRALLVEIEISSEKSRVFVNKQRQKRSRSLENSVTTTAFSPSDLELIKGPPAERRDFLDALLSSLSERFRSNHADFEKALRQRNALLKQCHGHLSAESQMTLDVWDERISIAAEVVGHERSKLIDTISPFVTSTYRRISGDFNVNVELELQAPWMKICGGKGMLASLKDSISNDLRREVTTVGPHRDDLSISLDAMAARTHASQGEQRSLAISLKLASHTHAASVLGAAPVLLLDDVFSELDDQRVQRFLEELPDGQVFLATATTHGALAPVQRFRVESGKVIA